MVGKVVSALSSPEALPLGLVATSGYQSLGEGKEGGYLVFGGFWVS